MKRREWKELLAKQPRGLSGSDLARRVKQSPSLVIFWAKKLNHRVIDGRKHPKPEKFDGIRKVKPEDVDWSQSNSAISKKHGVSRQRVWHLRQSVEKV